MKQYLIENRHEIVKMKNVQYRGFLIRFKKNIDPDSDPNPVSPESLDSDPVNIRPTGSINFTFDHFVSSTKFDV